jgi:hypothetical protein
MTKMKRKFPNGTIVISDSRRKKEGAYVKAYKVNSVAANGESLQNGEIFNDMKAVIVHLKAMRRLYAADLMDLESPAFPPSIFDATKDGQFVKKYPEIQR